jgi:hypothetical protein
MALEQLLARAKKLNRKLKARIKAMGHVNGAHNADASEAAPAPAKKARVRGELAKALAEASALRAHTLAVAPELAALRERVAALEAQPLPARAALRAVAKSGDGLGGSAASVEDAVRRLAELDPDERAHALMKLSLASPRASRV